MNFMARHITKLGYVRGYVQGRRDRLVFEHRAVWEAAHGPVPSGMDVHHLNADKQDNRLANLALVGRLEHKRLHSGCELREGVWFKPCRKCGAMKPVSEYYRKPDGIMEKCKACAIALPSSTSSVAGPSGTRRDSRHRPATPSSDL